MTSQPRATDEAAAITAAAVTHFGTDPASTRVTNAEPGMHRLEADAAAWTVASLPTPANEPYRLFEFTSDLAPWHADEAKPLVAVLEDGRSFLLTEPRGLAGFLAATIATADPLALARVVVHLVGRGMERVITGAGDLTTAGADALRGSGVEPAPPVVVGSADGVDELRFISAAFRPETVDDRIAVDFRAWTVRRLPDATVDWQARPVAVNVPDGVPSG